MGNSNSLPEIPGGGYDGYHVLRVQVGGHREIQDKYIFRKTRQDIRLVLNPFLTSLFASAIFDLIETMIGSKKCSSKTLRSLFNFSFSAAKH